MYPNIRYNLGGGQPQIAELQIGEEKDTAARLPGIEVCCETAKRQEPLVTEPMAIWYQLDKFLYLSPLSDVGARKTRLVAVDVKMVRSIHYLPKSVRVASGGRIVGVHQN